MLAASSYVSSTVLALLPVVLAVQKCYVCTPGEGEGSLEVEHQFPRENLPVCAVGHEPAIKECPRRYKGCLTQYNGARVTRSCGELALTVCEMANGIEYCYCTESLCNSEQKEKRWRTGGGHQIEEDEEEVTHSEEVSQEHSQLSSKKSDDRRPSDDEDLTEGSGTFVSSPLPSPKTTQNLNQTLSSKVTNASPSLRRGGLAVVASMAVALAVTVQVPR